MDNNVKFMDIEFNDNDLIICQEKYNELCRTYYPDIKQFDHMELYAIDNMIPPSKWRKFLLNSKVKEWLHDEQMLDIRKKINQLIAHAESNNTAQQATLNNLLTLESKEQVSDNKTIIIYNAVPLTENEKKNPNVKQLDNIPDSIKNATKTIENI